MKNIPRLMIAGTLSGVGKTSVCLGLLKAFKNRGLKVQAFKVGPDYFDPIHHTRITGRPSRNLDTWMCENHVEEIFSHGSEGADLILVEGVMGLFDGLYGDSNEGSSADIARRLQIPVVLVADAQAMARSFAALVHGYATFDSDTNLAGVIANRVASLGHFEFLKSAMTQSQVNLLGYLPPQENISIPERHLGLVSGITDEFDVIYDDLGKWVSQFIDLEHLFQLAQKAPELSHPKEILFKSPSQIIPARVAIARDAAFHCYYQDNLDLLLLYGAELIEFSPLKDEVVPEADLLIIGGGFPEVHAEELSKNKKMIESLRVFAETKPIFAECGGMMYLCQSIETIEHQLFPMAGIFDAKVNMTSQFQAHGYIEIETRCDGPLGSQGTLLRGHEFRYSKISDRGHAPFAFQSRQPATKKKKEDGFVKNNVQAGYAHIHFASNPHAVSSLLKASKK